MSMYETIGEKTYANLLADPQGADLIAIPCEPGNGIVTAGTVMYKKESGMWAPAASAEAVATNQLAVLNETVNTAGATTEGGTIAEDAAAYRAGRLIAGMVKLAAGATLTAAAVLALRNQGIFLDQKVGTEAFNNVKA